MPLLYITGTKVAAHLREAVKKIRPSTPADDLKKYSAHSLRVWACILLDKAGKSPVFIQKQLLWLADSFKCIFVTQKPSKTRILALSTWHPLIS
jgi:hypothetical protein